MNNEAEAESKDITLAEGREVLDVGTSRWTKAGKQFIEEGVFLHMQHKKLQREIAGV